MDDKLKSPVTLMAEALAKMTERAIEAERQRDAAKKDADNWYQNWQHKDAQVKRAEEALSAEIEAHEHTRSMLRMAMEKKQEGATDNG